jgi:hypothetical protein
MIKLKNKKKLLLVVISCLVVFLFWPSGLLLASPAPASSPAASPAGSPSASPAGGTSPASSDSPADTGSYGGWIAGEALSYMVSAVTFIIQFLIQLMGSLLILLMEVIVWLSVFNKFVDNPYVTEGWIILRDLVNMFFILGLLFIAFVTVLKIEKYPWNKLLARLLIMAILVNFSKTIVGLIIDFFQVLMITFVNAYKDITAGNIWQGLVVTDWFKWNPSAPIGESLGAAAAAVAASAFALLFTIVSCIVILVFAVILAFRIVALWALTVFSPLAFFAWVFQGSGGTVGSLANRWWSQFLNYCMIGPFMAFFLWLSVLSMVKLNYSQMVTADQYDASTRGVKPGTTALPSQASSMDNIIAFMMGIIMLVGGMKFSQEFAVAGSSIAGRAADKIKNTAEGALEKTARGAYGAATFLPRAAGRRARRAAGAYVGGLYQGVREGLSDRLTARKLPGMAGSLAAATTEKGAEQERAMMAGRARAFFGPRKKAKETAQRKTIDETKDMMEEEINWENKDEVNKFVMDAINSGNFIRAKAALEKVHEKKLGENAHVDAFKKRFVGTGKQYTGDDDLAWIEYAGELEKKGKAATGREYSYNKYYVSEGGEVLEKEDFSHEKAIMDGEQKKPSADKTNVMENDESFNFQSAQDYQEKRNRAARLFAYGKDHQSFGNRSTLARQNFARNAQALMSTKEGQQIVQDLINEGIIDEENINDLEMGMLMANAKYEGPEGNGKVVGGTSKENLTKFLNADQKVIVKQLKALSSQTKTGLGRQLVDQNRVSGIGKIDTSSLGNIQTTMGAVKINTSGISDPKLAIQAGKAEKARQEIITDSYVMQEINQLSGEQLMDNKQIEAAIARGLQASGAPATSTDIKKKYHQYKAHKLSQAAVQDKARKFVVKYGTLQEKGANLAKNMESETFDDTIADVSSQVSTISDVGDMGRMAEELKELDDQSTSHYKRVAEDYNLNVDDAVEQDQKKTKTLYDEFKRAKGPDNKRAALEKLLIHVKSTNAKRKNQGGIASSYLSGEFAQDRIRKELGTIKPDVKYDNDVVQNVQKIIDKKKQPGIYNPQVPKNRNELRLEILSALGNQKEVSEIQETLAPEDAQNANLVIEVFENVKNTPDFFKQPKAKRRDIVVTILNKIADEQAQIQSVLAPEDAADVDLVERLRERIKDIPDVYKKDKYQLRQIIENELNKIANE